MSLFREASGNVVLQGGDLTVRFMRNYGGAILQAYAHGFPPLLNEIAGAGWQSAVREGNDPTEASSNGITENPIAVFSDPKSSQYSYYGRETLFDAAGSLYIRTQFIPDFWLSTEALDDSPAPNADGSDTGWRTPYAPGGFGSLLNTPTRPVIFEGSAQNGSGYFFVGDECCPGYEWQLRLRRYQRGRVAMKTQISLRAAAPGSFAGLVFRASVPVWAITKADAYGAAQVQLNVNKAGGWAVVVRGDYFDPRTLAQGILSPVHVSRLLGDGVTAEIRTDNNRPGYGEVWFDGIMYAAFMDPIGLQGPHVGLFASCPSGYVMFGNRSVYDVGIELCSQYSSWAHGIVSDIELRLAPGVEVTGHTFDRANLPAVFLNHVTFPLGERMVGKYDGVLVSERAPGCYPMEGQYGFWAGNRAGTCGVLAIPEIFTVDHSHSSEAHVLIDTETPGGEFVLMLNPLPMEPPTTCSHMRLRVRWATAVGQSL